MGRKMKSIIMLIIVLILIYCQQMPVLYAEEEGVQEELTEENETEEAKVIEKYQLNIPQADGKEGYYVTVPEVEICHVSEAGATLYELKNGEIVLEEGRLTIENAVVKIPTEKFSEGNNLLTVYMEDDEGIRLEEYNSTTEIKLDTQAPQFDMKASEGFDTWYQKEVWISVAADDTAYGSQIQSISCYCGNELIGTVKEPNAQFLIKQASDSGNGVNVTVTVVDNAGNRSEKTRKLYIDSSAPKVSIEGVTDYMITSQPVTVTYRAVEENGLKECAAKVQWEDTDGNKQMLQNDEWTEEGKGKQMIQTLSEDGIYQMKVSAVDLASFYDEASAQIIIDSHNPVIRYVDELEGKHMKRFCWNYPKEMFIKDFTTFIHQIQVDAKVYPIGTEITSEGRHVLKVEAVDSAGNRAEAKAEFVIDHTPPEVIFYDVEAGGQYEEKKTFKVALTNQADTIEEVLINGVSQVVDGKKKAYQYTVEGAGDYEVLVKAYDKAGNRTVEELMFEVTPRKTAFQKVVRPVQKVFSRNDSKDSEEKQTKREKGSANPVLAAVGISAVIGMTGGYVMWRRKKR